MENKMTYVMAIDNALSVVVDKETKDKLVALKDSLIKKANAKRTVKPEVAKAKADLMDRIVDVLASGKRMTVSEIFANGHFADIDKEFTPQKLTSLLTRELVPSGKVSNVKEGKKSLYFATVDTEVEGE